MNLFKIRNNLYRCKTFWFSKKWLKNKPIFSFWRYLYMVDYRLHDERTSARALWGSLPFILSRILYAILIIILFESYNRFFPLPVGIQDKFDTQSIDTLLAAIASISGVFLGLYFTAISAVAGNLLLRATDDLRELFLKSREGEQYISVLVLTGVISIFYIVVKSFGHTIHPIGLVVLALLTAYAIIRFWIIGTEAFHFLQSSRSLAVVTGYIARAIKGATIKGFQWEKAYIQNHYQRVATHYLELLSNLINFGIKEIKLSEKQLVVVLRYIGGLLFAYSEQKGKIPTTSSWYKTKNQFQSWTLANSTEVAIALNTGTPLSPKTIKDFIWFEEQILDVGMRIISFFIDK